jgi:hypothetical protein
MGQGELGRYCQQKIGWLIPEVWKKWWRKKKKLSKMRIAKARAMSKGQRAGAVRRKQAKANTGPTPSRAATFAKRKKASTGGSMQAYNGPAIKSTYAGKTLTNDSLVKYYGDMIKI